jgi:hypothetical protein
VAGKNGNLKEKHQFHLLVQLPGFARVRHTPAAQFFL